MRKLKKDVSRAQQRESRLSTPNWDGTPHGSTPINDNTPRKNVSDKDKDKDGEQGGGGGEGLRRVSEGRLSEENLHQLGQGQGPEPGSGSAQEHELAASGEGNEMGEPQPLSAKRPSTRMTDELIESEIELMESDVGLVQSSVRTAPPVGVRSSPVGHAHADHDDDDDATASATLESSARSQYYNQMLVAEIHRLKRELRDMNDDLEQLTLEKFKIATEKDCTPSAMLFFSTLHDPNMVPTIQQLVIQLNSLKGVADCSTHMDFSTLRKRLLVCTSATQILDNFVVRYNRWVLSVLPQRLTNHPDPSRTPTEPNLPIPILLML